MGMPTDKLLSGDARTRGIDRYGNEGQACEHCMSEAMKKCADKPHDQRVAIAISECKDKCPTQPKNGDDAWPPAQESTPVLGGN
jgi:hypothetical protein